MAQKYVEIFKDSGETQYASGMFPLMGLAKLNEGVIFNPVLKAGGKGGSYQVQRTKRIKAKAGSATGNFGDDFVADLNGLSKVEWDTVEGVTIARKIIGVEVDPNEEFDIDAIPATYNKPISNMVRNTLVESEELATAEVIAAGTKTALVVSSDEEAVKDIDEKVTEIELLVDDFKAYSDGVVVLVHPEVAKMFSRVQGQSYQTGTNTFPEGLGKGFRYNGIDYFVSPILNAIESSSDKVAGAIVMDKEAYANMGLDTGLTPFNDVYLGDKTLGHRYYGASVVIDASRIKVLEIAKAAVSQSKKVNA